MGCSAAEVPGHGTHGARKGAGWWIVGIAAGALVLRVIHLYGCVGVPWWRHLVGDAAAYYEWAGEIAGGEWIGSEGFYQAPLYPYVLAVGLRVFGGGVWGIHLIQVCGGALGVACLAWSACRTFGRGAGMLSGIMLALYGPAMFFDGIVQKASLGCVLLCVLLLAMSLTHQPCNRIGPGLVGVASGLAVLVRENALIWLPFLAVWYWVSWQGASRRVRITGVFAYVVGVAVVLVPVGIRNVVVAREWSVTTFQAGPNFYIGNSRGADGRYQPLVRGHETPAFERRDATELAERAVGRELSAREVSRYWMSRAVEDIATDPPRWLRLMGLKTLMVWNAYEVSDVESVYIYAEYSPVLRGLVKVWHFGVLCPLAALGVLASWGDRRRLWIYYVLIVTMAFAVSLFYVLARYRFPLVPLLIPFAASGCVCVWHRLRSGEYRSLAGPVIVALVVAVAVNWPVHDERRLNAMGYMNLGVVLAKEGDLQKATGYFRRAVTDHPESVEGHNNLAQALALQGDYAGAIPHYEAALAVEPGLGGVDYNLGVAMERVGRVREAVGHYQRAVTLDPADMEAQRALTRLGGQ